MNRAWIKNTAELAITSNRQTALEIISAGLNAIDTAAVINAAVSLDGEILNVKNEKFDLKTYRRLLIVGFGKTSATAAFALEQILGNKISGGVVIDSITCDLKNIQCFKGTHPKPSPQNVAAAQNIVKLAEGISEQDLVIAIVSGGGSSLLCWTEEELVQSSRLYDDFLKTGGTIKELNTIRKHISQIKGDGLAKLLYPAKIVSLVFCDIPGSEYNDVASGPTFKDKTTTADAEAIIKKYGLKEFHLYETLKDDSYFKNVTNIPLVTNEIALNAMAEKGVALGLKPKILSSEVYDSAKKTLKSLQNAINGYNLILAGGEIQLQLTTIESGTGGRNQYLALQAVSTIKENELFISIASDGIDNSDAAGAITDSITIKKARDLNLNTAEYTKKYDAYNFFRQTGDLIFTGPTGANVADLMLLLKNG